MIIIALLLVLALATCGQKTNEAVNDDNIEKSDESMETLPSLDEDNDNDESTEHKDSDDDSDDDSINTEDSDNEDDDSINGEDGGDDSVDDIMSDEASDGNSMNDEDTAELKVFTLEELSAYNGLDGSPAYVAVDGVVYDFTNLGAWRNGKHNGFTAGRDLTDEILNVSPHGVKNLEGVPIVGSLAEE